ncbi:hypothetical protein [Priestia koreensis]|uniref:hypothetical protein n=1 Tax=Priestia koreensis TaxID=284581 RepID=UPI001F5A803D|nr:hypothetical protein [Priestia koreensis]MCM3006462.1 hypothetical protein [Priestia koreensis]UNL83637.1 hypothetical protein IE339_15880 [Priestia koreensis]
MKKIWLFSILFVVIAVVCVEINKLDVTSAETNSEPQKVIYSALDEDLKSNSTISAGIHNTSMFLNSLVKNATSFSQLNSLNVVKKYSAGAVELARKKNATRKVHEDLVKVNQLIKESIKEKDLTKLKRANHNLIKIDLSFNENVLDINEMKRMKQDLNK